MIRQFSALAILMTISTLPCDAVGDESSCSLLLDGDQNVHQAVPAYRRGLCYLRANDAKNALEAFFEAELLEAPAADFIAYQSAQALIALKRAAEARGLLEGIIADPQTILRERAMVLRAMAAHVAEDWSTSTTEHNELIRLFPDHPQLHEIEYRLAIAELRQGNTRSAVNRLASILRMTPLAHVSILAEKELMHLRTLGTFPSPLSQEDRLEHGRYLRSERRWAEAAEWLEHSLSTAKGEKDLELQRTIRREIASMRFAEEKYELSLAIYQELWVEQPDDEIGRQMARCLQRLGDVEAAKAAHWKRLEAGGSRSAIIRDISSMLWWEGRYSELEKLNASSTLPARQASWRESWLLYRTGRHKEASTRFLRHGKIFGQDRAKATYWAGRALMDSGERAAGMSLLEELGNRDIFGYYGLQAVNRLYEAGRIHPAMRSLPPAAWPTPNESSAKIHWPPNYVFYPHSGETRSWEDAKKRLMEIPNLPAPITQRLQQAFFLRDAGDTRSALHMIRHLVGARQELRKGTNPDTLANRGPQLLFDNRPKARQTGLWGSPRSVQLQTDPAKQLEHLEFLKALTKVTKAVDDALLELHVALGEWHFLGQDGRRNIAYGQQPTVEKLRAYEKNYSESYPQELTEAYRRYGLQPDLVRSVMHVESRSNPLAISRSDARGLMQILPRTGRLIARELLYREFGKELLLEPGVALHFGTWYLKELIQKFEGQEVLAVCSYNTGPFNVAYWLQRKPDLPFDVFLEEVPWKQPRTYVKKVLANLQIYSWIRTGSPVLYVSNGLSANAGDNINF